jgi:leucyl aminopeptidase
MPISLRNKVQDDCQIIIYPVIKGQDYKDQVRQLTGMSFVPDIHEKSKSYTTFFHTEKDLRVLVLSLGEKDEISKTHTYVRYALHQLKTGKHHNVALICSHLSDEVMGQVVLGSRHSLMDYGFFKSDKENNLPELNLIIIDEQQRVELYDTFVHMSESQLTAMHLVDYPSNLKTPEYMAHVAVESGKKYGYDVKVYDTEALTQMGMHALLAVGRGAEHGPRCIVMEYNGVNDGRRPTTLGLVGKGISYDTGGLSIKTSAGMSLMKCDMSGAAAVIGLIEAVARLKWPVHVVGVVPAAENSVDALSYRPGDVIGSYSGKSIEVIDTDAEGRLVLADGLSYMIKNFKPDVLIDLATLTGSCVATLGSVAAGLFTHNDQLAADLSNAGEVVNERLWRLPLWKDYDSYMHSDIADIRNLGNKPTAGAVTAAKFLEFFTEEHPEWAHLDIAGVAFTDSDFAKSKTATGFGVRLLLEYIQNRIMAESQTN